MTDYHAYEHLLTNPEVFAALAGWLDAAAEHAESNDDNDGFDLSAIDDTHHRAVNTARAILRWAKTPDARSSPAPAGITYLLWSHKHSMWWRRNAAGYTTEQTEAGRYTEDVALDKVRNSAACGILTQVTSMVAAPNNWGAR